MSNIQSVTRNVEKQKKRKKKKCDWNQEEKFPQIQVQKCLTELADKYFNTDIINTFKDIKENMKMTRREMEDT